MKKAMIAALLLALPAAASSADEQNGPRPEGGGKHGGFMMQLTEEQKACIENQGCPKREKKGHDGGGKHEKPQMTDEEKAEMEADRECRKKAFETCGIQMPERPEGGPKGGRI
ncbi:MAG: hypothetical protein LBB08_00755 [Rickettsiales bacterium]|jgi:hypothetical protein|nr:hypothetical protein [Rickettsiales bacterium]